MRRPPAADSAEIAWARVAGPTQADPAVNGDFDKSTPVGWVAIPSVSVSVHMSVPSSQASGSFRAEFGATVTSLSHGEPGVR